jgi:hypothetical protein
MTGCDETRHVFGPCELAVNSCSLVRKRLCETRDGESDTVFYIEFWLSVTRPDDSIETSRHPLQEPAATRDPTTLQSASNLEVASAVFLLSLHIAATQLCIRPLKGTFVDMHLAVIANNVQTN